MAESPEIQFSSGVSVFDGSPFVLVQWGQQAGQLTPDEAEAHAVKVIACATAARYDAAVMAELTGECDFPREAAAAFIVALRGRLSPG